MNNRQDILRSVEATLATVNEHQLRQASSLADSIDRMKLSQAQSLAETVGSFDKWQLRQAASLADSIDRMKLSQAQSLAEMIGSFDRLQLRHATSLAESIEKISLPKIQPLTEVTKYFDSATLLQMESMARLMDQAISPFNVEFSDMVVDERSTVTMSGEIVETTDFNRKIIEISEETSDLYEFIDEVSYWISGLPTDKLKKIACFLIFYIFVPYMVSILAGQTAHMHPNYFAESSTDYRSKKKEIIQDIREESAPENIKNYRVVVAKKGLHVRSINSKKGDVIGGLPFGSVVLFLEKTKSWSFVEYEDEYGDAFQGWVYSRYLNKL